MARRKLLIAAVIVGLFAAALLYLYATALETRTREFQRDQVEVVKAARNIPAGTPLTRDRLTTELVPQRFLPPNPLLQSDLEIFLNNPVSMNIDEGAMILTSDFAVEREARNLAAKIPAGERAYAVAVDSVSGVAGLLEPGDRVDILGTFPMGDREQMVVDESGGKSAGYATLAVLQAVTVLAVGQRMSQVEESNGPGRTYSTLTISVTIGEAELLTLLQTRGKLTYLLRSREDLDLARVQPVMLKDVMARLSLLNEDRVERVVRQANGLQVDYGDRDSKTYPQ